MGSMVSQSDAQYWCWHEVSSEERPGLMELRLRGLRPPRKLSVALPQETAQGW